MKPELQRVKIAEACGWKWIPAYNKRKQANFLVPPKGHAVTVWRDGGFGGGDNLPNYPEDLNAIHEAEKAALETDEQIETYLENLTDVCGGDTPRGSASFTAYFATAAQRAEALLRTLGLWEDPKEVGQG